MSARTPRTGAPPAGSLHEILGTTRARTTHPFEGNRLRQEAARQSSACGPRLSEHLLGRNVESRLPDGLPALQRGRRHRLRAFLPAAETGARRAVGVEDAA